MLSADGMKWVRDFITCTSVSVFMCIAYLALKVRSYGYRGDRSR